MKGNLARSRNNKNNLTMNDAAFEAPAPPVVSTSFHGGYVWVQTDLVEAILERKHWKPRKRSRSGDWGWCRARVVSSNSSPIHKQSSPSAPYSLPALRKVSDQGKHVHVTLSIEDDELAPLSLQHQTVTFSYHTLDGTVCIANAWWHSGCADRDDDDDEADANHQPPDDLTQLEQLHEPAVVYCLQRRYEADDIYTYTGKILLALNPFRSLPLYTTEIMRRYAERTTSSQLKPHIYAIAQDAWTSLQEWGRNQSILVSGESGSGKTVTTKICLRYLADLSQQRATGGVEQQVLQSNPILESFGNARTVRNDNSSRFGKFIILQLQEGCLVSASIETYLLEKVRLISQAPGERNFHVFYEILAGLPQAQRRDLHIANRTAKDFHMTAQSGTFNRRDGVDDRETWKELLQALETVGFSPEEQGDLFHVTCGLLHASNLTFTGDDAIALDRTNPSLKHTTELFGVDPEALNESLTKCRIEARGEVLYKNLTLLQALKATEALIKVTYGALFEYIVRRINESIRGQDGGSQIGILDIFGFESLETNSLEQLCINYCNEALQQQFNRFVFKLEQQEYQREGIEWSFISFPDNQDVLDLIEKKHEGILSILDEQCRLARCTDATFARTVYDKFQNHVRFEASASQQGALCFAIHHYAGLVEYDTANFVEKSKDELPKEAVALLEASSYPFLAKLGESLSDSTGQLAPSTRPGGANGKRQLQRANSSILRDSVGVQFSSQLKVLRVRIESTEPHYVRCLKPNDGLVPRSFQPSVIADQLTCAGVLEAIRVSRVGFPNRYYHEHFVERYSLLSRSRKKRNRTNMLEACREVVEAISTQLIQLLESEASDPSSPVKINRGRE